MCGEGHRSVAGCLLIPVTSCMQMRKAYSYWAHVGCFAAATADYDSHAQLAVCSEPSAGQQLQHSNFQCADWWLFVPCRDWVAGVDFHPSGTSLASGSGANRVPWHSAAGLTPLMAEMQKQQVHGHHWQQPCRLSQDWLQVESYTHSCWTTPQVTALSSCGALRSRSVWQRCQITSRRCGLSSTTMQETGWPAAAWTTASGETAEALCSKTAHWRIAPSICVAPPKHEAGSWQHTPCAD